MEVLVLKCYMDDNFNHSDIAYDVPLHNSTFNDSNVKVSKAAEFGTLTGIVIALVINFIISLEYHNKISDPLLKININEILRVKNVVRTIALVILVAVMPVVLAILLVASLYKLVCLLVLRQNDKRFVKFLDSFDVFWSLEDDVSKSIINVLGIIESESPQTLVDNIKEKLENLLLHEEADKIFYRRNERYGFYYWRKFSTIDINEYVQIIDQPDETVLSMSDLEELMAKVAKKPLPYHDEGLFQILVTKNHLANNDINDNMKQEYGIIFRIHHSVGDGVALIDFLCKTLADETQPDTANMFNFREASTVNSNAPSDLMEMIRKLCEIPVCFVDGIVREADDSSLHGPKLLGGKVFKWTKSDENLFLKVKEIKDKAEGLHFSDVLAAALSAGLHTFFSKTMTEVPETVAVVLPVRFPKPTTVDRRLDLKNDFSVTTLDLPTKTRDNIHDIQIRCRELRKSADPITNYYFLKLVSGVLPRQLLQPLLNSSQATLVFSNMPGPDRLTICGGNLLKQLVFFAPHKGTTGLGVTCLHYGGVLRFAAMADEALVSRADDLDLILEGMVAEVNRLHRHYVTRG
ncbi:uncharacterized protein LOC105396619 [Plutella xylostella]|uniref:uncharacterized protein LOC105396619 n=1 Tax=Plutella xylostella TaxID=51655 RepID=UPI0020326E96|nr:uncharacterized protein LOC105396619 [Plutella xylostella]